MRGEIIHYDDSQGLGLISADDGSRYAFGRDDLRQTAPLGKGTCVDFRAQAGRAHEIFPVRGYARLTAPDADGTKRRKSRFFQLMTALGFTS